MSSQSKDYAINVYATSLQMNTKIKSRSLVSKIMRSL